MEIEGVEIEVFHVEAAGNHTILTARVHQVQREQLELPVLKVNRDRRVLLELQVCKEFKVFRG